MMETVFVTGATGFIGQHTCARLREAGCAVRGLARIGSNTLLLRRLGVEIVRGDLTDFDSLVHGCQNATQIVHLAGHTSEGFSGYEESYNVNVGGAQCLVMAARATGIRRIVSLGTQSSKRMRRGPYGTTKALADEVLLTCGLDVTILRPTLVYGPGVRGIFAKMLGLIRALPVVPIIGNGEYCNQPVLVGDLVEAICSTLNTPATISKIYDVGGADRVSFNQLVETMLGVIGQRKPQIHVPSSFALAGAKILSAVMARPLITPDNVLGLIQETTIDLKPAQSDFGFRPLGLGEGLRVGMGYRRDPHARRPKDGGRRRIAVIGFGKMGLVHASLLNVIPEAQLVAIADPKQKKLAAFAGSLGVDVFTFREPDTLLDQVEIDGAIACAPPAVNRAIAEACVGRGIHLLIEKPLASSLADAERIAGLAAAHSDLITATGYMVAYIPLFNRAREIVQAQELGLPRRFTASANVSQVFSSRRKSRAWRYVPSLSGGGVVTVIASHLIFLLDWFFGMPTRVGAEMHYPYSLVEDEAQVELTYQNGLEGRLDTSWSKPGYPELTLDLRLECEGGWLHLTNNQLEIGRGDKAVLQHVHRADFPNNGEYDITGGRYDGLGYFGQDRDFVRCIGTGQRPKVTWENGLRVQRVIQAVYESAAHREATDLK